MKKVLICLAVILIITLFISGCSKEDDIITGNESPDNGTNETSGLGDITAAAVSEGIKKLIVKEDENETSGQGNETYAENNTEEEIIEGDLVVSFIDVEHGDSIFVQTPRNGTLLIDGGFDDQGSVVMKYLQSRGITYYIDAMLATHPDKDNVGGLDSVLYNMIGVSEIYDNGYGADTQSYQAFIEFAALRGKLNTVTEDTTINLDESTEIQVIVPYMDSYLNNSDDNSLVVKITYGDVSFLLMGDCGYECEQKIMGHDLKADILKVAHCGANDSTSNGFLDEVNPKVAIISSGRYSEFGHPDADVVERLLDKGIEVLRTDQNGTIVVRTDGERFTVRTSK